MRAITPSSERYATTGKLQLLASSSTTCSRQRAAGSFTAGDIRDLEFQVGYFMTMRRGADGVGAAGEIENVTHVFQPSGRFSAANSL